MSLFKRIWIDKDPDHEEFRKKVAGNSAEIRAQHQHGAPLRRRNRLADSPHWDPLWRGCLSRAADELKLDRIIENWQMKFRTLEARDAAMQLAEALWAEKIERRRASIGV